MSDVVVTVPKGFWEEWIAEGDAAGDPWSGEEWGFFLGGRPPRTDPGERVYIVCREQLRGYAPLVRVDRKGRELLAEGRLRADPPRRSRRRDDRRYRWWDTAFERPFPEWKVS